MAQIAGPRVVPVHAYRKGLLVGAGLLVFAAAIGLADPGRSPQGANFSVVFASLLVEAVPFVLLGASVSALIEVVVPGSVMARVSALPPSLQLPASAVAGLAFPVCECGSVPVARRLIAKGLAPSAAITFMLAAPVLNPIVIASTVVAYAGRASFWPIVAGRVLLALGAAMAVGWVVGRKPDADLLRSIERREAGGDETHRQEDRGRVTAFFEHLASDFLFMGRYLVLGAAIAASLQTFVPQAVLTSFAGLPVLDLVGMMALAFVLSLCSESDAFVAASFVQFGVGAQLAFLVFGPMVDTKLSVLYGGAFNRRLSRTIAIAVAAVVLAGTLWVEILFG
jgi:uncharacterized membrane protein YraQ (UPF0718 family)